MPTASITQSNQTHAPPAVGVSLDVTYSEQGHFAPGKAAVTLCEPQPQATPLGGIYGVYWAAGANCS